MRRCNINGEIFLVAIFFLFMIPLKKEQIYSTARIYRNIITNDGERQVTQPSSPLQSCRPCIGFRHSRSRSRAVVPDTKRLNIFKG